jgi:hypothetical protein
MLISPCRSFADHIILDFKNLLQNHKYFSNNMAKNNGNLNKNTKLLYNFNYVIISTIFNNIINILFICDNCRLLDKN